MDLVDVVAASLLPRAAQRAAIEALRAPSPASVPPTLETLLMHSSAAGGEVPLAGTGALDVRGKARDLREEAAGHLARARARAIDPLPLNTPRYPVTLTTIVDPPLVLWVRGGQESLHAPAVAIVGSRAASPYAVEVAERLAGDLVRRHVVIVSGLARGVDAAAHRGALCAGGRTVAVLGSGADIIYPADHDALAEQVLASGALVVNGPAPPIPRA